MPSVAETIEAASKLALYDAAFLLWYDAAFLRSKWTLDKEEATAHDNSIFGRLRRAHPNADGQKVEQAIKAAVKLDSDCIGFYSSTDGSHGEKLEQAIEAAKNENPGFSQSTYDLAAHSLFLQMM